MSTEIMKTQSAMPAELLRMAIDKDADITKIEKLIELQERWENKEAKKAFAKSMVATQSKITIVKKTRENKHTHSMFADLGDVVSQNSPIYTAEGFSISFYEGETTKENHIRICADVMHEQGHKESYFYDAPMEGKGLRGEANMTPTHAKAATVSYGRRYLMCMILNIPTGDDVDGNKQKPATKDEEENPMYYEAIALTQKKFNGKNAEIIKWMKENGANKSIKQMDKEELSAFIDLINKEPQR